MLRENSSGAALARVACISAKIIAGRAKPRGTGKRAYQSRAAAGSVAASPFCMVELRFDVTSFGSLREPSFCFGRMTFGQKRAQSELGRAHAPLPPPAETSAPPVRVRFRPKDRDHAARQHYGRRAHRLALLPPHTKRAAPFQSCWSAKKPGKRGLRRANAPPLRPR